MRARRREARRPTSRSSPPRGSSTTSSTRRRHGIDIRPAELPPELAAERAHVSKRIYRILELNGYARLDFRLDAPGELYFLEANPNPEIAEKEEFASSARHAGVAYPELLERILRFGLRQKA